MIAVIPRGIKFKVELNKHAKGYLCENMALPLTLPKLGAIGANGLAHPRHFIYPDASYEDTSKKVDVICKFDHACWCLKKPLPLNVVAWHGNYAPTAMTYPCLIHKYSKF